MLKAALVTTAAFVTVAFAAAMSGSPAMAATPNCLTKANKYVACTDRLKTKTGPAANGKRTIRTTPLWGVRARSRL
jgi:hypothetical protein